MFVPSKFLTINKDMIEAPNLCDRFGEDDLSKMGGYVWSGYLCDKQSRMPWERRMSAAMDLAMQVQEVKTFPWPGASNVIFPLITIAALQFSGRSYTNIIQGTDVVKYRVIGDDPEGKAFARAERVGRHMSWQCMEQDQAWEEQHDRLLINLSIVGSAFGKTFFNGSDGHNVTELVMAKDFVIDYWAKSIESAARKSHCIPLYKNEIYERVMQKVYRDVRNEAWFNSPPTPVPVPEDDKRKGQTPPQPDEDTPFATIEQHRWFDLDGDGYAEPYIATIEHNSRKLLRLTARFDNEEAVQRTLNKEILCIKPTEFFTNYTFIPSPDGGIYGLGFGTFLGPINEAVNSGINQLLDNGTMQNSIGGFLGRGAKMRGGNYTMAPWEWKRIDSTGDDLRKNMVPYPERQPSAVMFQLIGLLIEYANRISGTTDEQIGKNPGQNTPASTFQGMQESGMQVYSMIFKRVWRSMREEFKKLYLLNRQYLGVHQKFGSANLSITRDDYMGNPDQIAPVADPNITSTTMRIQQAQLVADRAHAIPGYSLPDTEKGLLKALRVENIDKLYPGPDKVPPLPNPKVQIEQGKMQLGMAKLALDKQKFQMELMNEQRLNQAKIIQLQAQAALFIKQAGNVGVAEHLEAFELAINAMQAHNEMLTERIKAIGEANADGDKGGDGGVGTPPGDAGTAGGPSGVEAGAGGAVGGQGLPAAQSSPDGGS